MDYETLERMRDYGDNDDSKWLDQAEAIEHEQNLIDLQKREKEEEIYSYDH